MAQRLSAPSGDRGTLLDLFARDTALLADQPALAAWAEGVGVPAASFADLAGTPALRAELEKAVASGNRQLSKVEQVKRFAIIDEPWDPTSPEMTPTMKLRWAVIAERHHDTIESLYAAEAK